jgi:hypothetical protein
MQFEEHRKHQSNYQPLRDYLSCLEFLTGGENLKGFELRSKQTVTVSFHILSNILFTNDQTIRRNII